MKMNTQIPKLMGHYKGSSKRQVYSTLRWKEERKEGDGGREEKRKEGREGERKEKTGELSY